MKKFLHIDIFFVDFSFSILNKKLMILHSTISMAILKEKIFFLKPNLFVTEYEQNYNDGMKKHQTTKLAKKQTNMAHILYVGGGRSNFYWSNP